MNLWLKFLRKGIIMDKIAINHKTALKLGFDYGLVNELNISKIYGEMKTALKQPSIGYFYADDVDDFFGNELLKLLESEK
jgi:hypothetical protein